MSSRLEDVVVLVMDCEHNTAMPSAPGAEFGYSVGTADIRDGRISLESAKRVSEATYERWTRRGKPQRDDLILAREAPVGQVGRISGTFWICLGQRTVLVRPNKAIVDPRYLHYLLLGPDVQQWMQERASGSTVEHLNVEDVRQIALGDLPATKDQHAIAGVLGALDDKIEANDRTLSAIDALVRAEVAGAQLAADSEIPLGDLVRRVSDIAKPAALSATTLYVGLEHMTRSSIFLREWGSGDGLASAKSRFESGDILFGKLRPYFKKIAVAPAPGVCSTEVLVLRPRVAGQAAFSSVVCASDEVVDYASSGSQGTRMPRVSWDYLSRFRVPVPSVTAMEALHRRIAPQVHLGVRLPWQSSALAQLRDALLPKLLCGELLVPEAEKLVEEAI